MSARTIKTLLIANRGEIALRIIRSAKLLGLRTVAVFSEPDARAAHVAAADEAHLIGPAEAARSYLNIGAIIDAARKSKTDAIHPGYGFLSERPEFARAAEDAGMIFVGPSADVMAVVGDKVAARRLAIESGVPIVPGTGAADLAAAREFARTVGFPILVKAAAGGGGRGMRVVQADAELPTALETAAHEAQAAFGDGRLFIEKYLTRPRHVEIQILADQHAGVVALGERDCSIQRRHQKIIEESPAPGLDPAIAAAMADAAVRLAKAAGYRNAGTVEFLVDGDRFYFLEVNARIQVEHPITELRFGCDLVCEQLRIAAGERVGAPDPSRGCAIECRIYAEDAGHDFRPAIGRVIHLRTPNGPGVRFDSHLTTGADVTADYDGLLAKLICFGATRDEARRRMVAALDEFALVGVTNTAAFLRDVVASEPFARADLSTRFITEFFPRWRPPDDVLPHALLAAALATHGAPALADRTGAAASSRAASPWTMLRDFELFGRR